MFQTENEWHFKSKPFPKKSPTALFTWVYIGRKELNSDYVSNKLLKKKLLLLSCFSTRFSHSFCLSPFSSLLYYILFYLLFIIFFIIFILLFYYYYYYFYIFIFSLKFLFENLNPKWNKISLFIIFHSDEIGCWHIYIIDNGMIVNR